MDFYFIQAKRPRRDGVFRESLFKMCMLEFIFAASSVILGLVVCIFV